MIAGAQVAHAELPLDRGRYLMSSIVACGNCHTPQGPNGPLPGMELAGGLKIEDKPPMAIPYYAKMKADDLNALVAYLRSLPSR